MSKAVSRTAHRSISAPGAASLPASSPTTPTADAKRPRAIRCAIYTRKSSEEGLEQEFNSLDAQREAGEAYVMSQKAEGWVCLPDRYDDGGFTGGNMDRPGLKRLMEDIEAGRIDCVVVYKVDRLSRSLMDFARMMSLFETHGVSFVSVTQQFNTTHSMGRLTLNILLSFAQFEREIISERTRDKIMASKRKGKWFGGIAPMGYRAEKGKLVVVEEEACRVREIFAIYLRTESLGRTVAELKERGWKTRLFQTSRSRRVGGRPFEKSFVYALLTNVAYIGKVMAGKDVVDGQHEAIVDAEVFARVQRRLAENARTGGSEVRNVAGAILKGLVRCGACDAPMHHSMTYKGKGLCYRYYVCHKAKTEGRRCCPSKSLPAEQIERFVLDRVKAIGKDRPLLTLALEEMRRQDHERLINLEVEQRALGREGALVEREVARLAGDPGQADRLAEVSVRSHQIAARLGEIAAEVATVQDRMATRVEVEAAAAEFDPIWSMLSIRERSRLLRLVVKAVEYDGRAGELRITFHPENQWLAEAAQEGAA